MCPASANADDDPDADPGALAAGRFRVAVAGGGIAGVTAMMALADLADRRLAVDLITPGAEFVLGPQHVGEPWGGRPLRVGLGPLCDEFGTRHHQGALQAVDAMSALVTTADGAEHAYDAVLVTSGAVPRAVYPGVPTVGLDGLPDVLARTDRGSVAVIVPPGCAWTLPAYQLALLAAAGGAGAVRVVTPERRPLQVFGPGAAGIVADFLTSHGVGVESGRHLEHGSATAAALADHVVTLPVPCGPKIRGLPAEGGGFVPVDALQRVRGSTRVFAAGDVTASWLKQGGLAAAQAEVAAFEIARLAGHAPARTDDPPTVRGKLVAGEDVLYLRRRLADAERDAASDQQTWRPDADPGVARDTPLWKPEAAMLAWRLSRWLTFHRRGLGADPLGPVARPLG